MDLQVINWMFIILKGVLIGIIISAPMGPVGMLIIQRTLRKGPLSGFVSGVGATFSDLFYALITATGLSFVMDFIASNEEPFKAFGSLLLLFVGIFLYRSNPKIDLKSHDKKRKRSSYWQDFITAFGITLLNPFIIFFLLALYTRFYFLHSGDTSDQYIVGLLSICVGALLWWAFISFIFGKLRKRFNPRGLKIMNRVIGGVLCLSSLYGIIAWIVGKCITT